eukprot:TRINITY_DN3642_c0_g1_i3.p1 TRINITY_DN3642_c0_g1~~TRINITY_DN3642_c0_g1_i3.p1  ORF type:complete len:448 (+),score=98.73 TRINITY_DN3642_c0_g1_i3:202-1344(+)
MHRTGITALLWNQRQVEIQKSKLARKDTADSHQLTPKKPSESFVEVNMPFSKDSHLRDQYLSPFGHLRIGRILEDLDAMAGNIAFRHADDGNPNSFPLVIVTASLDRIKILQQLLPDQDMKLEGHVTWVGRSSMEIEITASTVNDANVKTPCLTAVFTMVATDPNTKKSTQVNPLLPTNPQEQGRFNQGEFNRQQRLERKKNSLMNQPPTADERFLIHNIFMERNRIDIDHSNDVPMSSTKKESIILCQPSERNFASKIFGGYLMRKGFELAFSTVFLFAKSQPFFSAMDDVAFHKPVEIGSILSFRSKVVYCKDKFVQVEVTAHVTNPSVGKEELTNVFNFTFECKNMQPFEQKKVIPETYAEAMSFLEGRRINEERRS